MTWFRTLHVALAAAALALPATAAADPVISGPLAYAPTTTVQVHARQSAALRVAALGLENASFADLRDAARAGYGPAARRLGEIYDNGTRWVKRDVAEAMRWYHVARQSGEDLPTPHTIRIWAR